MYHFRNALQRQAAINNVEQLDTARRWWKWDTAGRTNPEPPAPKGTSPIRWKAMLRRYHRTFLEG